MTTPRDLSRAIIASPNQSSTVFGLGGANPIRQKSLFVMRFLRRVGEGGEDWRNGMTFLVKSVERPSVNPQTEEINQYNKKRVIHTGVKYSPVNCTLYDTADGAAQVMWAQYASYYFGDYRQEPSSYRDDIINERMNGRRAGYGYGIANTSAQEPQGINSQFFFDSIEVYQVWGGEYVAYRLLNPKITTFNPDELDYEQNAAAMVSLTIQYEGIYHENGGKPALISENQTLLELFRGQFSGNTYDPVGTQTKQNSFTSAPDNNPISRLNDVLARTVSQVNEGAALLENNTLPTSAGSALNRFGTFAFGDFSTLGNNLPSEISTMVGNQDAVLGALGQDVNDIPDIASAINFAADVANNSPLDQIAFNGGFFGFDTPPSDTALPVPAETDAEVTEDSTDRRKGLTLSPVVLAAVNSRSNGTSQIGQRAPNSSSRLNFVKEPTPVRSLARPLIFGKVLSPVIINPSISAGRGVEQNNTFIAASFRIFADIRGGMTPGGLLNGRVVVNSNSIGRVDPIGSIDTPLGIVFTSRGWVRVTGAVNSPVIVSSNIFGRSTPAGTVSSPIRISCQADGRIVVLRSSIFAPVVIRANISGRSPPIGSINAPIIVSTETVTLVEILADISSSVIISGVLIGQPTIRGTISHNIVISSNIRAQTFNGNINGQVRINSEISAITSWGNLVGQVIVGSQTFASTAPSATIQSGIIVTPQIIGITTPASILNAPVVVSCNARGHHRFGSIAGIVTIGLNSNLFVYPVGSITTPVVVQSQIITWIQFGQINASVIVSADIETLAIAPRVGDIASTVVVGSEIFAVRPITASLASSVNISMEAAGISVVSGSISTPVRISSVINTVFVLRREGLIDAPVVIRSSGQFVATVSGELAGNINIQSSGFAVIPNFGPIDANVVISSNVRAALVLLSDPLFENVILLIQPDGVDESTDFIDNSQRNQIIVANGQAEMDTGIRRFSPASFSSDGVGDYLSIANNSDFTLPLEFTVEAFVRFNVLNPDTALMGKWGSSPTNRSWLFSVEDDDLRFSFVTPDEELFQVSYDWSGRQTNVWYHLAASRDLNGDLRLFIDGLEVAEINNSGTIRDTLADFVIGDIIGEANYGFSGNMDQIRVTTASRYTDNFIVPISGFPIGSGNFVEFVGSKTYSQSTGVEQTVTFDNLSGGIDSIARSGDMCVIFAIQGREQSDPVNISLAQNNGFDVFGPYSATDGTSGSRNLEALVAFRQADGPPPTNVRVSAPKANSAGAIHIMVFRNVAEFPFHARIVAASFIDTNLPTPPTVFPTRTGTMIVTMGGGGVPTGMPIYDDPLETNYASKLTTNGAEKNQVMSMVGYTKDPAPGNNFNFARWTSPTPSVAFSATQSASLVLTFAFEPSALSDDLPSLPQPTAIKYWYRADKDVYTDLSATSPALDGNRIALWGNQGSQEDAIQSNAGARPSFEVDLGVNRLPSVRAFDGYFEDLLSVGHPTGITQMNPFTVYMVCDRLPINFTNPNPVLGLSNQKNSIFFRNVEGSNIEFFKSTTRFGSTNLPYYIVGMRASSFADFRRALNGLGTNLNNSSNTTSTGATTVPFLTDPLGWTVAGRRDIFQGNIYEFIYFDGALSDTEFEIVNQYILSRYTPRISLTDPAVFNSTNVEQNDVCVARGEVVGQVDPDWDYTSVLISGVGEEGSQIFGDRSKYGRAAIANGNVENDVDVVVGTVPSIKHTAYGDHIRRVYGPELDINTVSQTPFCMEAYVVCNDLSAFNTLLGRRRDSNNYWLVVTNNRLQFATFENTTGTTRLDVAADMVAGQQHHIAVVRVGQTYYGFVDGVLKGSNLSSGNINISNTDLYLGESDTNTSRYWRGNTNWFRLTIGRPRYSITGFTPPSLPLAEEAPAPVEYPSHPPFEEVVLLADFDNPASNTTYTEKSLNRRVATFFGNARLDNDTLFTSGKSLFLDGTGDFITFPDAVNLRMNTDALYQFTMEAWVKVPSVSATGRVIASKRASNGQGEFTLSVIDGRPTFVVYAATATLTLQANYDSAPRIQANTWHHIAVCGSGSFYTLFLDGKLIQTGTRSASPTNGTTAFHIGRDPAATTLDWLGWIEEFRFIQGRALYTSSFEVPTTASPRPEYLITTVQEESDAVECVLTLRPPPLVQQTFGYGVGYGRSWGSGLPEEDDTLSASATIV